MCGVCVCVCLSVDDIRLSHSIFEDCCSTHVRKTVFINRLYTVRALLGEIGVRVVELRVKRGFYMCILVQIGRIS